MIYMEFILFGRSFTMRKNVKRLLCGLLAAALLIPCLLYNLTLPTILRV